jgi:hypothetical protein
MAFMEPIRPLRVADDWFTVLKRRATLLGDLLMKRCPPDVIAPCVMDLYTRPDIRTILEQPLGDHGQDTVDEATFMDVLPDMDVILPYVRAGRIASLLAALRAKSDTPDAITEADLDRPTSLFQCSAARHSGCTSGVMNCAMALVHRCEQQPWFMYREREFTFKDLQVTDHLERMRCVCTKAQVCGGRATFELHSEAIARAKELMALARIDPTEVTIAYLDKLDLWFSCSCRHCVPDSSQESHFTKSATDWRHLVSCYAALISLRAHPTFPQVSNHHYYQTDTLSILDENEKALAIEERDAFEPSLRLAPFSSVATWACARCDMSPLTTAALQQHLENM